MVSTFNPNTGEEEAGESPSVGGQPGLHSDPVVKVASLYMATFCIVGRVSIHYSISLLWREAEEPREDGDCKLAAIILVGEILFL